MCGGREVGGSETRTRSATSRRLCETHVNTHVTSHRRTNFHNHGQESSPCHCGSSAAGVLGCAGGAPRLWPWAAPSPHAARAPASSAARARNAHMAHSARGVVNGSKLQRAHADSRTAEFNGSLVSSLSRPGRRRREDRIGDSGAPACPRPHVRAAPRAILGVTHGGCPAALDDAPRDARCRLAAWRGAASGQRSATRRPSAVLHPRRHPATPPHPGERTDFNSARCDDEVPGGEGGGAPMGAPARRLPPHLGAGAVRPIGRDLHTFDPTA